MSSIDIGFSLLSGTGLDGDVESLLSEGRVAALARFLPWGVCLLVGAGCRDVEGRGESGSEELALSMMGLSSVSEVAG